MDAMIGIFDSHDDAVIAVRQLKEDGYPVEQLTIMGKATTELIDSEMHITPKNPINIASLGTGTVIGTTIGILTGVGIFAIPGLGFLYGAGALIGAIAGFDFGLIGGGIAAVLATIGAKDENAHKYHDALEAGKFLVIAHGTEDEVFRAKDILKAHKQDLAFH